MRRVRQTHNLEHSMNGTRSRWLPVGVLVGAFYSSPNPAGAAELDINVNDDAARGSFAWQLADSKLALDAGWLHHQDRGDVAHFGLHLVDFASAGTNPIEAGIGTKLFYFDSESLNQDGLAGGLGGFFRYTFPNMDRIKIGGSLYYAPDVLATGDAESYREIGLQVAYNVLREADVYLGFRNIKGEFDNGADATIDSGLHIGFRLEF